MLKRRKIQLVILVALVAASAACIHRTFENANAQHSYTADQVVIRVNELQAAVIQAYPTPTDISRKIVEFTVSADKVLKASPSGWQAAVTVAWTQTKSALIPPPTNPAVVAAIAGVDTVLAAYGGK